jgi:predicted DNA-binding transcriptional regulator YafY
LLASEGLDSASLTKRVRAVHAGKRRLELKCFQSLAQATLERKKVNIHHYNRQRGETTERDISPQQLVHYRDNWYVDAWCHLRNKLLNFSVDAITNCDILEEVAKEVSQKDIKVIMQSGYGIFGGEANHWAKLKFNAVRARWVQAEEWHPEQKSTVNKDGTYTLEFPYSDERELLGDILRFGADVEVLAPKTLRTSLLNAASETIKLYN